LHRVREHVRLRAEGGGHLRRGLPDRREVVDVDRCGQACALDQLADGRTAKAGRALRIASKTGHGPGLISGELAAAKDERKRGRAAGHVAMTTRAGYGILSAAALRDRAAGSQRPDTLLRNRP